MAAVVTVAVFAKEDALPGAHSQSSSAKGDGQAAVGEGGLHVGRHIVGPFHRVGVGKVFGSQGVERPMEVLRHVGIGVLVGA